MTALRYVPTESERAELALANACSSVIVQSGLHECDDRWVGAVVTGIRIAAGDRWATVEQAMMGESD